MKHYLFLLAIISASFCCFSMENNRGQLAKVWAQQIVTCINKRQPTQLEALLEYIPIQRTRRSTTATLIEQLKTEKETEDAALADRAWQGKRLQNKLWAIFVDLGLPIAGGAFGLTEGILAKEKLLIAFGAASLVFGTLGGIPSAIDHWTMKSYEDKVMELDVWIKVLEHVQPHAKEALIDDLSGDGEELNELVIDL